MLSEFFGIKKGDIVSITGSSGKTSLMFKLAREFEGLRVLVTTTTKIQKPAQFDHLYIGEGFAAQSGLTVIAEGETKDGKLYGYSPERLCEIAAMFDCCFIESDGAAMKPLKAWNDYEPTVISNTSKTIGVINVSCVGREISEEFIHRKVLFAANFSHGDSVLSLDHLISAVAHKNGLFKNSVGKRMLFINRVESALEEERAIKLADTLLSKHTDFLDTIIYGSIKEDRFTKYTGRSSYEN